MGAATAPASPASTFTTVVRRGQQAEQEEGPVERAAVQATGDAASAARAAVMRHHGRAGAHGPSALRRNRTHTGSLEGRRAQTPGATPWETPVRRIARLAALPVLLAAAIAVPPTAGAATPSGITVDTLSLIHI